MTDRPPLLVAVVITVALGIAAGALAPGSCVAGACVPLSPAQMFLAPDYSAPGTSPHLIVQTPGFGPLRIAARDAAVSTIQVLPPQMVEPAEAFVPDVDYAACLDPVDGSGRIDFQRTGPYLVRVGHADGYVEHLVVHVGSLPGAAPPASLAGYTQVTSIPNGANGYTDAEFVSGRNPDNSGYQTQMSVRDLVNAIQIDAGAGQIDVALRYHGSRGTILIGSDTVGLGPNGRANLQRLCAGIGSQVRSVTLLSCETGEGAEGCEFIQELSRCLGGRPVYAMTGTVTSVSQRGGPTSATRFVQNGRQVSSTNCP